MGDCNPACQKIIINSGFVAPLAELLAALLDSKIGREEPWKAARRLADTARAHVAVFEHAEKYGVIARSGSPDFTGCEQAAYLMAWIGIKAYLPRKAVEQMDAWSEELEHDIRKIVSGTLG